VKIKKLENIMKNKLGYCGQHRPKDYTEDKYIVLPTCVRFKEYYERVGSLSPILLESEISLDKHDIDFMPIKVNVFIRDKFMEAIYDDFQVEYRERAIKQYDQMSYATDMKERV
jgi:hypothetical protein